MVSTQTVKFDFYSVRFQMKNICSILLLVNVVFGTPTTTTMNPSSSVSTSPKEFSLQSCLKSLPVDKLKELVKKHIETDPGFVSALRYLKSPEWAKLKQKVHETPQWITLKEHLVQFGVNIDELVDRMDHCLNATKLEELPENDVPANLTSFINEMREKIALPIMKAADDMITDAGGEDDVKKYLARIGSEETKKLTDEAIETSEVKAFLNELKKMGVPVESQLNFIYVLLGWPPRKFAFEP